MKLAVLLLVSSCLCLSVGWRMEYERCCRITEEKRQVQSKLDYQENVDTLTVQYCERLGRLVTEQEAEWNKLGQAWIKFHLTHP